MKTHTINGTIKNTNTNKGKSNLRVEAWELVSRRRIKLADAITNSKGNFSFNFGAQFWSERAEEDEPKLFFKVYDNRNIKLTDTYGAIYWTKAEADKNVEIGLDIATQEEIEARKDNARIAEIADLSGAAFTRIEQKEIVLAQINDRDFQRMVAEKTVTVRQGERLTKVLGFSRFTNRNLDLTAVLVAEYDTEKELIKLSRIGWINLLDKHKITLPKNVTKENYAADLANQIARRYPTAFLVARLDLSERKAQAKQIKTLAPIFENNKRIVGRGKELEINWDGINTRDKKKINTSLTVLKEAVNTFGRLGLEEVINDEKLSVTAKEREVSRRLGTFENFQHENADLDLRHTRFFGEERAGLSNPNWTGTSEEDKPRIRKQLMSYQRILMLSINAETTERLLENGLDSAYSIGTKSPTNLSARLAISEESANKLYRKANHTLIKSNHYKQVANEVSNNHFVKTRVDNLDASLINDLKEIDGYDDLFGIHSYCSCDHCKSIFSPAAYFVDLMHFVQKHISENEVPVDHAIHLEMRRSDLWNLELSCENTNEQIPYLEIVNTVLEAYISNIQSVGVTVYDLLEKENKFALPFNLPLVEIRAYLKHFDLDLKELIGLINPDSMHPEFIGLSKFEFDLIKDVNSAAASHAFTLDYRNDIVSVQRFLEITDLSRKELDELSQTAFIKMEGDLMIERIPLIQDPKQYREVLNGISDSNSPNLYQLIRLYKKIDLSIAELVVLLDCFNFFSYGKNAIKGLIISLKIRTLLDISMNELLALMGGITQNNAVHNYLKDEFKIISFASLDLEAKQAALISGLKISASDLEFIKTELNLSFADNALQDIDQLYRYVKLAKLHGISIAEFLKCVDLWKKDIPKENMTVAEIEEIVLFSTDLKKLPLSISEIWNVLHTAYFYLTKEQVDKTKTLYRTVLNRGWTISELSDTLKIDEKSAALILDYLAEGKWVSKQRRKYVITEKYEQSSKKDLDKLNAELLKEKIISKEEEVSKELHTLLSEYFVENSVIEAIAEGLDTEVELISEIGMWVYGLDSTKNISLGTIKELDHFLEVLEPLLFMANQFDLKSTFFAFLTAINTQNKVYFLKNDKGAFEMNLAVISELNTYQNFANSEHKNAEDILKNIILEYGKNKVLDFDGLASLTDYEALLISDVYNANAAEILDSTNSILDIFSKLTRLVEVCTQIGIDGTTLNRMQSTETSDLKLASQALLSAFHAKYEDKNTLEEKLAPYIDELNAVKRDALVAYIRADDKFNFDTLADLYEYFLLDVEMGGCSRTTKVLAANASLQLYIHRCFMNLEQSESDPIIKAVIDETGRSEWEWRKNYRIWEANRKVFLYPENYIEPDLRDNKSAQFKGLEDELLQRTITKEAAEEAYKKYVTQFSELSKLIISGTYYDIAKSSYYFFGRTNTDPYQYYYRTYAPSAELWTAWEKIELAINAAHISAIKYQGKLFLFWVEIVALEQQDVSDIDEIKTSAEVTTTVAYSYLKEDGQWLMPQKLGGITTNNPEVFPTLENYEFSDSTDPINDRVYPRIIDNKLNLEYSYWIREDYHFAVEENVRNVDLFKNKLNKDVDFTPIEIGLSPLIGKKYENSKYVSMLRLPSGNVESYKTKAELDSYIQVGSIFADFNNKLAEISADESLIDIHKVLQLDSDKLLITFPENYYFRTTRLTTSLADKLGEVLFNEGLDAFMSLKNQNSRESNLAIHQEEGESYLFHLLKDKDNALPFDGAYGLYYNELYFHIPALIANHLNATGKYKEAKYWYEKIFNPTAAEDLTNSLEPLDRNWQHIRFRNQGIVKMIEILTDEKTIAKYKEDPFNPHAIARLRMSAYQKNIVMKYIDNLLDWADQLFAQDTYESINEATMLYVLAKDILGHKPQGIGACETLSDNGLTYANLSAAIEEGSEFLIALENKIENDRSEKFFIDFGVDITVVDETVIRQDDIYAISDPTSLANDSDETMTFDTSNLLAFCVPPNQILLDYWSRVDDRLYKVRHCMNIKGMTRGLPLFQPEIDPMLLVRAKEAGLSLTDVMASLNNAPPAYRFTYLIEKAKQFTGTVQGFGSALLSALEKKDVEELMLLRNMHEENILTFTKEIKNKQLAEAEARLKTIEESRKNIVNRKSYYAALIDQGLNESEFLQGVLASFAQASRIESTIHSLTGSMASLIPQFGSLLAMTYGGREISSSIGAIANMMGSIATMIDAESAAAGRSGSFQRREQGWKHQLKLIEQELVQFEQQKATADIGIELAKENLKVHKTQTDQIKELSEFYKDKFTNLGLYDYLSNTLSSLYRDAYNLALNMAKKAEQTYRYERDIVSGPFFIQGSHWQADKAGLLAGEKIMLQLNQLDNAYMESNSREYDITQTFSLMQLDALSLIDLKVNGSCEFNLPEYAYDLVYPGQYKRRIKSVRLTIPCITGPYTNVNATLNLLDSKVRRDTDLSNELEAIPNTVVKSIATSNANGDAGVFELNFRDERYLPFEGAGAISNWKLELPAQYRTFDYNTISDILIHLSYTAVNGGEVFRGTVEGDLAKQLKESENSAGLKRLFSIKHEFANDWFEAKKKANLLDLDDTTGLTVEINKAMFPFAFQGKEIVVSAAKSCAINEGNPVNWKPEESLATIDEGKRWSITLSNVQFEEVEDILLIVEYKVS